MVLKPEFRPVQRAEVSTTDEAEAEEFIRQQYVENHARFLSAPESGRLSATAAQACGIAGDDFRSSIDYSAACDPFDYCLFFTMFNGRLRFTCGGDDTIVLAAPLVARSPGVCLEWALVVRLRLLACAGDHLA